MKLESLESRRLLSINPLALNETPERDTQPSDPTNLFAAGDTLYFAATDGVHGQELWKSDGTAAGTVMVKDLLPGAAASDPTGFALLNGAVYFVAKPGATAQLWKTDGTEAATTLVADSTPGEIVVAGNTLYIVGSHSVYKSDGT